jgi:hypothetical protein
MKIEQVATRELLKKKPSEATFLGTTFNCLHLL